MDETQPGLVLERDLATRAAEVGYMVRAHSAKEGGIFFVGKKDPATGTQSVYGKARIVDCVEISRSEAAALVDRDFAGFNVRASAVKMYRWTLADAVFFATSIQLDGFKLGITWVKDIPENLQ